MRSRAARPVKSWSVTKLGALAGVYQYRTMARGLGKLVLRGHTPVSARALLKRWLVNSMPLCRNRVAQRGRPSQLLQAQEREGAVDKGSGPLDQRSTKQLKSDLARSELAPRKKSFVREILRRRREAKAGDRSRKYVWFGAIITVFGLVGAALRQFVNRAK